MRIMGLDYGSKTIGVAISDPLGLTAQGVEIIRREDENKLRKSLRRIEELVKEYEVEELVLGFPKNMNNTIGERAEKSLQLKETLERRLGLPVVMWDERLTTILSTIATLSGHSNLNKMDWRILTLFINQDIVLMGNRRLNTSKSITKSPNHN